MLHVCMTYAGVPLFVVRCGLLQVLAAAGVASRRACEKVIESGVVKVRFRSLADCGSIARTCLTSVPGSFKQYSIRTHCCVYIARPPPLCTFGQVNGVVVHSQVLVDPAKDAIEVEGRKLRATAQREMYHFVVNKPKACVPSHISCSS
jgi:16S rRNA U516 pseudouridylate synthase RsuA-like enzyme